MGASRLRVNQCNHITTESRNNKKAWLTHTYCILLLVLAWRFLRQDVVQFWILHCILNLQITSFRLHARPFLWINWDLFILFLNWCKEGKEFPYFGKDKPVDKKKIRSGECAWQYVGLLLYIHLFEKWLFGDWQKNSMFLKSVWTTNHQHQPGQSLDIQILIVRLLTIYSHQRTTDLLPLGKSFIISMHSLKFHILLSAETFI